MSDFDAYPAIDYLPHGPATTRCPVRLSLADGRVLDAEIYLLSDPPRPS